MKEIKDFVAMIERDYRCVGFVVYKSKEYEALKAAADKPMVVTDEMVERAAQALRAECLKIFNTNWNNDIAIRFANTALEAAGSKQQATKKQLEPKKQTLLEYRLKEYCNYLDIMTPNEVIKIISDYLEINK